MTGHGPPAAPILHALILAAAVATFAATARLQARVRRHARTGSGVPARVRQLA